MPRTRSKGLTFEKLRELARAGAEDALKRLRAEIGAIERTFPELASGQQRRAAVKEMKASTRRMSAATRKAVSQRMKKYCTKPLRGSYLSHNLFSQQRKS